MKKLLILLLCLSLASSLFSFQVLAAPEWPEDIALEAEAGILIDANTGTVLAGKNIDTAYFPASITKILTALIVIENCNLDEEVTFSHNAVFNVESGSSSAGMDVGDKLSVRDCLYALLLKSANEVANALAEHVGGTVENFCTMMNEKAASLGCTGSNFMNPSGLNNPDHYVTARDMAIIAQAAFKNETFMEIDSTTYYKLPITKRNPEGLPMSTHHQMMLKNRAVYYPGVCGGKTGYTTLAGNTLVTYAEKDGMSLITVILNGHQTHYSDTKTLLDYGFTKYKSLKITDYDTTYTPRQNDLSISSLALDTPLALYMDPESTIILPKDAEFTDAMANLTFTLDDSDPDDAVARVDYTYGDREVGCSYLKVNPDAIAMLSDNTKRDIIAPVSTETESDASAETESTSETETETPSTFTEPSSTVPKAPDKVETNKSFHIPFKIMIGLICVALLIVIGAIVVLVKKHIEKKDEEDRLLRKTQREQRLKESGFSTAEFDYLMEQRRASFYSSRKKGWFKKR